MIISIHTRINMEVVSIYQKLKWHCGRPARLVGCSLWDAWIDFHVWYCAGQYKTFVLSHGLHYSHVYPLSVLWRHKCHLLCYHCKPQVHSASSVNVHNRCSTEFRVKITGTWVAKKMFNHYSCNSISYLWIDWNV